MPRPTARSSLAAVALVAVLGGACGDDGGADADAFCETARRFEVDNPASALAAYDPAAPEGSARLLRDAADALDEWAGDAPEEVGDDVEVLRDAAADLADAFEAPGVDAARVSELEATFPEVEAASARVLEFARTACAVDLAPATSSSTTTP